MGAFSDWQAGLEPPRIRRWWNGAVPGLHKWPYAAILVPTPPTKPGRFRYSCQIVPGASETGEGGAGWG